jgi:hypothetical protein
MPVTKAGIETARNDRPLSRWSQSEYCRTAVKTPRLTPTTIDRLSATAIRMAVFWKRRSTIRTTGSPDTKL